MASKKKLSLHEIRAMQKELAPGLKKRIKGGFKIVPSIQPSYGSFPWLEIDIRNPAGTPPGDKDPVKIVNVFNP